MKFLIRSSIIIGISALFLFSSVALAQRTNLLPNGDLEIVEPNFWNKVNEGLGNSVLSWDMENGYNGSRCVKVEKPNTSSDLVGWKSVNNAQLYWNNARAERLYNLSFQAKTEGVNTNPASDDEKIGVLFQFLAAGTVLGEQFITIDQSA
ncbi:MAG TPA: hypothetical protein ENN22_10840, partial [bacterium]|nr:hypothetical protein [bacterium]